MALQMKSVAGAGLNLRQVSVMLDLHVKLLSLAWGLTRTGHGISAADLSDVVSPRQQQRIVLAASMKLHMDLFQNIYLRRSFIDAFVWDFAGSCFRRVSRRTCVRPVASSGKTNINEVGLNSIEEGVVKQNLMGKSRYMDKKGWVDAQGRKGKVRMGAINVFVSICQLTILRCSTGHIAQDLLLVPAMAVAAAKV